MAQPQIEINLALSIHDSDYLKDIWDVREFGIVLSGADYIYTLSFTKIKQAWLKQTAKSYARYDLTVNSFATVRATITVINKFSAFIALRRPNLQPNQISRQVIVEFLGYLAEILPNPNSRRTRLCYFSSFLQICSREKWLEITKEQLIYRGDLPKLPKIAPKYIPQEVLEQLNKHLIDLPKPVGRMLLVLQESGMRVAELCTLKFDCIAQDGTGSWWLTYYQSKMKKENTVPISREIAEVIRQQQEYISKQLGFEFPYLFCGRKQRSANKGFIPVPRPMKYVSFRRYLNKLASEKDIRDASGQLFPLGKVHQFRHTAATSMVNNGVPIHVIKRFFGWESYAMVIRYTHTHDETLKKAIESYYGTKVVNIAGDIVKSNRPELDTADMQWFRKNIQAQALPNGYCGLPMGLSDCPHANACLTCGHFRTSLEFLEVHKQELEHTRKIIEKAKQNGWQRQVEMNERVVCNLENIIHSLESSDG